MSTNTGINKSIVKKISKIKGEPKWMQDFRLQSLDCFLNTPNPIFGPELKIDFDDINYYKRLSNELYNDWDKVPNEARNVFDEVGVIEAEKKYLDGIGAQFDSEAIYHNMLHEVALKNVIFCDTDTALKKYPDIFKKYFNNLVKYDENKYTALNGAVWSGGTFIYVPPNTVVDRPLQSYFRINTKNMGQFERTIIVVDDNSTLHYMEGCTAPTYTSDALHAAVVEIYVGENAKCRYTTIQNWSRDVYNLVTKRAIVEKNGVMEWVDGNIGSKVNMKYPACILKGEGASGTCISVAVSGAGQIQDTGAKMIHLAPNTTSFIISKSIATSGGNASYRGCVKINKNAFNSKSFVKCDSLILDELSKSDTVPLNVLENASSKIEHEATVSRISQDKLFYLMRLGITEEKAKELLIMGFLDKFIQELPMEYAVELNALLKNYFFRRKGDKMKKYKVIILVICLLCLVGCTNKKDIMKKYAVDYYNQYMKDISLDKYVVSIQMLKDANKKVNADYDLSKLSNCTNDSKVTMTLDNDNKIIKYKYELNCN